MKFDTMSTAHRLTRALILFGDKRKYSELLSISLKVRHMFNKILTIDDINRLMNIYPTKYVSLKNVRSLHKNDRFVIEGNIKNCLYVSLHHYSEPRTQEEINTTIGVLIASERKQGIKTKLD